MTDEDRRAWDLFAAVALLALMSKNETAFMEEECDSHNAADYADAMLRERRERTSPREQPAQDVSEWSEER